MPTITGFIRIQCSSVKFPGRHLSASGEDSLYRGREDFVYRIALGELPLVTGVFPLGGPLGAPIRLN